MATPVFSSPIMRARSALVRGLAAVDEVERAWARQDWEAVRRAALLADQAAQEAGRAMNESWGMANVNDADPAETEAEARLAWGDR